MLAEEEEMDISTSSASSFFTEIADKDAETEREVESEVDVNELDEMEVLTAVLGVGMLERRVSGW